jgi:hypothetical protein
MARTDFETELNLGALATGTLSGGITELTVTERVASGYQPNQIIRYDHDWQIKVKWELVGSMLDSPFFTIPGKWIVKAYLEGWGVDADDKDLNSDSTSGVTVVPAQTVVPAGFNNGIDDPPETEWQYVETFTIRAADNPDPGTYKLAVAITYEDEDGNPGPMAGFIEFGDMIQIYEATT